MSLKPVKEKHSISRAVVNLFLAQNFPESEFFLQKIIESQYFQSYQRKSSISEKLIQLGGRNINVTDNKNNGFVLEEFDSNGVSSEILRIENTPNNKSVINFETRNYSRWDNLKTNLERDFNELTKLKEFYVEAIGLTYVDEFLWDSEDPIPVKEIFDNGSELLNSKFLDSKTGTLVSVLINDVHEAYEFSEEKSEISFDNKLKRIVLSHTYVLKYKKLKVLENTTCGEFLSELTDIHGVNKEFLSSVLSEATQKLISLN